LISILFQLAFVVINLFKWAVIGVCVFSLLTSFGVLDTRNRMVWTVGDFLYRVTEPVLAPIRRIMPNLGAVDLSPFVVLILIQIVIIPLLVRAEQAIVMGSMQPFVL
jgi:YggT family protein